MPESKSEQEPTPSTSQIPDVQNKPLIPLVSLPKVVLTRLDINNLPVPVKVSPTKKLVKRLDKKMNKPITPNKIPQKAALNSKHDPRTRNRPKQNYKAMAEFGISFEKSPESNVQTKKVSSAKKEPKMTPKLEDRSVKNMLNKTMLQKRSKIIIPPAKKRKLTPTKPSPIQPKDKPPHVQPKIKNSSFKNENDDSDVDSLFDELINEIVKRPQRKVVSEKTTNITLKPNVGNKPPTIVKGGIVKKSSLPPDLKAVASPTTLNSSKHTVISLNVKGKSSVDENAVKAPATAESPKASLPPVKASPFPISLNSPSKPTSKDIGKKGRKIAETSVSTVIDDPPIDSNELKKSSALGGNAQKQNLSVSTPRPRGRPKIGPKQAIKSAPSLGSTAEDESDEYTEIETLENVDSDTELGTRENNSAKNGNIQEIKQNISKTPNKSGMGRLSESEINKDEEDPHLDLLRILTDDNETAVVTETESQKTEADASRQENDGTKEDLTASVVADKSTSQANANSKNTTARDSENTIDHQTDTPKPVKTEAISQPVKEETEVFKEPVIEDAPPVRTVYDLINEVSQQYPSWNLHIIPETNAFCIAQVTKGRLGLPTLKKCIELDAETYCAKVYIHQYHIKRFDGIYDSEEAILALIEEIHSIKA